MLNTHVRSRKLFYTIIILILNYNVSISDGWNCDVGVNECIDTCNFESGIVDDTETKLCKLMCSDNWYWCPNDIEIDVD